MHEGQPSPERPACRSDLMARLTLSTLDRLAEDPSCWREPMVHRALLVSGLSVLISSLAVVEAG